MSNALGRIVVKSARPVQIRSLSGHCFAIPANTPTDIPIVVAEEAYKLGCFPVDVPADPAPADSATEAAGVIVLDDQDAPTPPVPTPPVSTLQLAPPAIAVVELLNAFQALIETNDKANFKTDGTPRVLAVQRVLKRDVSAAEVDVAWQVFQLGK